MRKYKWKKIKYSHDNANDVENSISKAIDKYKDAIIPTLQSAKNSAQSLGKPSVTNAISTAQAKAEDTKSKLESFKTAVESYFDDLVDFNNNSSSLLYSSSQPSEWDDPSGWTADSEFLKVAIRQKLIESGMTAEDADAVMQQYGASLYGLSTSSAYCGAPINISTGNFLYHKKDLAIEGFMPLEFVRFYNTMDGIIGSFGLGWTHNFNIYFQNKQTHINLFFEDGHCETYQKCDEASFTSPKGNFNALQKVEDDYVLTKKDCTKYYFSQSGKIS